MSNDIVKINPQEFGLDDTKAAQIKSVFMPMLDAMVELEEETNRIKSLPITPDVCKMAKELRNKYVKIRTKTAEIHKSAKEFYLNGGRFVDAWKKTQLIASTGKEEELEKIEKHFELIERARIVKLEAERWEIIKDFVDNSLMTKEQYNLGNMDEEVFKQFKIGMENNFRLKKEAEQQAKETAEKLQKEEDERRLQLKIENEKLREKLKIKQEELKKEQKKAELEKQEQQQKLALLEKQNKIAEEKVRQISQQTPPNSKENITKENIYKIAGFFLKNSDNYETWKKGFVWAVNSTRSPEQAAEKFLNAIIIKGDL